MHIGYNSLKKKGNLTKKYEDLSNNNSLRHLQSMNNNCCELTTASRELSFILISMDCQSKLSKQ